MKANRITRVNEIIRRELATQLYRIIHRPDFDPAEVTITHVVTAVDLRTAKVMVSVRGDDAEGERVLHILKAARAEFQEALRDNVMLRYTPHLQFVRDTSVAEGDRVLELLGEMERAGELPPADDAPGGAGEPAGDGVEGAGAGA